MKLTRRGDSLKYVRQALAVLLAVVVMPVLVGAWQEAGRGINTNHVARIKDGQTSKHEILLLFGDPQEVERSPEGVVFTYKSYMDQPQTPSKNIYKEPEEQSMSLYVIDDDKRIKPKTVKKEGKILKSTLVVRFKAGSDTVVSHEYKELDGKK